MRNGFCLPPADAFRAAHESSFGRAHTDGPSLRLSDPLTSVLLVGAQPRSRCGIAGGGATVGPPAAGGVSVRTPAPLRTWDPRHPSRVPTRFPTPGDPAPWAAWRARPCFRSGGRPGGATRRRRGRGVLRRPPEGTACPMASGRGHAARSFRTGTVALAVAWSSSTQIVALPVFRSPPRAGLPAHNPKLRPTTGGQPAARSQHTPPRTRAQVS